MLDIETYVDEIEETEEQRVATSIAAGFPCLRAGECPRPPLSTLLKPGDVVTGLGGYGYEWSHAVEASEECTLADALAAWEESHEAAAAERGEEARHFFLERIFTRKGRKRGRTVYTLGLGT